MTEWPIGNERIVVGFVCFLAALFGGKDFCASKIERVIWKTEKKQLREVSKKGFTSLLELH